MARLDQDMIGFLTLSFLNFVPSGTRLAVIFLFFFFFRGYFVGGCYFWKIIFNTFDSKIDILSSIFATYLSKDFSGGEKKKRKMEEE